MGRGFDLLGHPIPENHGKRGANGHTPTAETTRKIRVLLLAGMPKKMIAEKMGLSIPTLNKHYFASGKISYRHAREMALAEQKGRAMLLLDKAAGDGKVAAIKAVLDIVQEQEIAELARLARGDDAKPAKKDKPLPKGKKEALQASAADAIESDPLLNPEHYH